MMDHKNTPPVNNETYAQVQALAAATEQIVAALKTVAYAMVEQRATFDDINKTYEYYLTGES